MMKRLSLIVLDPALTVAVAESETKASREFAAAARLGMELMTSLSVERCTCQPSRVVSSISFGAMSTGSAKACAGLSQAQAPRAAIAMRARNLPAIEMPFGRREEAVVEASIALSVDRLATLGGFRDHGDPACVKIS